MDAKPILTRRLFVLAGISAGVSAAVAPPPAEAFRHCALTDADAAAIRRTGRPNYARGYADRDPMDAPGGGCSPADWVWRSARHRGEPDWPRVREQSLARRREMVRRRQAMEPRRPAPRAE